MVYQGFSWKNVLYPWYLQWGKIDFTLNFVSMGIPGKIWLIFTPTNLNNLVGQSIPILSIISPPIDNEELFRFYIV